jgi:ParB-like chromosome segregation protein Spo0J
MLSRDDAQVHSAAELDTTTSVAQGAADHIISPTGQIPAHPFAEIFPLLGEEALRELAGDVAERKLIDPIVLYQDKILDGRCRYRACLMAGVEPRFETITAMIRSDTS